MKEIRKIIRDDRILYNAEINRLLEIIFEMFDIDGKPCLKIDNKIPWGMAFVRDEPYNFYLNWQMVGDNLKNKKIKEANYWIFFYCLHEVMHHRQLVSGITDDKVIQDIFNRSYNYLEEIKKEKITQVFQKIMYRMFHDYFPLEINADIMAYIKLLEVLREIDMEYYDVFLDYFKRRIEKIYEDDKLNDIYAMLLELDINLDNYSVEEKIIYGMPINREIIKTIDVVQLIK